MMSKFANVPVEDDTTILFEQEVKLGEIDILYQKWVWDGITAESMIFLAVDVADLDDEALKKEVCMSPLVKDHNSLTISHSDSGYVFVNFNSSSG